MTDSIETLLAGLCRTDEDRAILKELAAAVTSFDDGCIAFEGGFECEYEPPADKPRLPSVPASFHAISATVGAIWWDGGGPEVGYALEDDGSPSADDSLFHEVRAEDAELAAMEGEVVAAFMAGQNGLYFDPTRALANGEPALAFLSHEGGGWEPVTSVDGLDYGQLLLRLLADAMIETQHVPEVTF